jgi:hypothetical protein
MGGRTFIEFRRERIELCLTVTWRPAVDGGPYNGKKNPREKPRGSRKKAAG